jgi:hypothetical protein
MKKCILLALFCSACSSHGGVAAPTPVQIVRSELAYEIHIPDANLAYTLLVAHPNGVEMSPVEAQRQYDFTSAYRNTPNVYAGFPRPAYSAYQFDSIVIAPYAIASVVSFPASAWPDQYGRFPLNTEYTWVGHFVDYPPHLY